MSNQSTKIFVLRPCPVIHKNISSKKRKRKSIGNLCGAKELIFRKNIIKLQSLSQLNGDHNTDWKLIDGLYGLLALGILIAAPVSVTLLPTNNVVTNPEYWYEITYSNLSVYFFLASASAVELEVLFRDFIKLNKTRMFAELFFTLKISELILACVIHLTWSETFHYHEPFPFRSLITGYLSITITIARLGFLFPKQIRKDQLFRKRCKAVACRLFWGVFINVQLKVISALFNKVSLDYQWMIALIVPVTKEFNDRIVAILMKRSASKEDKVEAEFMGKILVNQNYSLWIAIALANQATKASEWILLGINFCINMRLGFTIVRVNAMICGSDNEDQRREKLKKEHLAELILNELIEIIVPIAFICSFATAYYGPNKNKLGSVGCTIWQHRKVENLKDFTIPVVEMALIDSGSLVLNGILLWYRCKINIWQEYCRIIKKCWIYVAFRGGVFISVVSIVDSKLLKGIAVLYHNHFKAIF